MLGLKKLKLSSIWSQPIICNFEKIAGHNDIKSVLGKAILSKRPVHVLLIGSPGSAKTMFLTEMMKSLKYAYFTVGSNTTKAGLINQLFEKKPKYLLIDELEKMPNDDQTSLLHLMETGVISETKIAKTRQTTLTAWVFATANNYDKIIAPLLSRFVVLTIPEYDFEEFIQIAVTRLREEDVGVQIANIIAEKVWFDLGSKDVRDLIKVSRLANNEEDISSVIRMMKKHRHKMNNL